jgi:ATP-dependent RNA helicase DeaD
MHGDMNQSARDRVMMAFRGGKVRFLVATDVIGRGIDVTSISHIVNYDIPAFCDDYVHRVGRTGRMGREGVAYTFVAPDEGGELTRIEERINRLLKRDEMKDFDPRARENIGAGAMPGRPANVGPAADGAAEGEPNPNAPPPPPTSMMRRPPKRYKRAL